jgi:hypothetical protein
VAPCLLAGDEHSERDPSERELNEAMMSEGEGEGEGHDEANRAQTMPRGGGRKRSDSPLEFDYF